MHSPDDELPAMPDPGAAERDLYTIFGYIGIGAIGITAGIAFLIIPEPRHWWHVPIATALIVAALLPWVGAYGLGRRRVRALIDARARRAIRHADLFRGQHQRHRRPPALRGRGGTD